MRNSLYTIVLVIGSTLPLFAGDWNTLFADRLQDDIPYREAVLERRAAEIRADVRERPYLPYLELGTGQDGIRMEDGEVQPLHLRSTLAVRHVMGTTIEVGVPFILYNSEEITGPVSLRVSRPLFSEDGSAIPAVRAALLRAQHAERSAYLDAKLDLVEEILDAQYSTQLLQVNQENLRVLERVRDLARDPGDEREVSRRILQMERGILQAEYRIKEIASPIREHADRLYEEVLALVDRWLEGISPEMVHPGESPTLQAQQFELAAARYHADRSFLPWVPNPVFSAGVEYDPWQDDFRWSLAIQVDATILDRGERSVDSMRRREQVDIERLRLNRMEETLERRVADVRHSLRILDYDRRLKLLDIEDEQQFIEEIRALYDAGFETEENLIVAETDLSVEQLALIQITHNFMLARLELLRYSGEQR